MNPEFPNNPREELELRVTALLLSELSADEAAAVREAVAKDPELTRLHDDLQETIQLVRQAATKAGAPVTEQASAPMLSEERRKKLLTHFAIPPLKESDCKPKPAFQIGLIEALAALAIIAAVAAMLLPSLGGAKSRAQRENAETMVMLQPPLVVDSALEGAHAEIADQKHGVSGAGSSNVYSLNVVGYNQVNPSQLKRVENRVQNSGQLNKLAEKSGKDANPGRSESAFSDYLGETQRGLGRTASAIDLAMPAPKPARPASAIVLPALQNTDGDTIAAVLPEAGDTKLPNVDFYEGSQFGRLVAPDNESSSASTPPLDGAELVPLPIQYPALTLKGMPEGLPSGPNIEPLSERRADPPDPARQGIIAGKPTQRSAPPLSTYTFDQNFLDYFGSNGVEAVDKAFAILKSAPVAQIVLPPATVAYGDEPAKTVVSPPNKADVAFSVAAKEPESVGILKSLSAPKPAAISPQQERVQIYRSILQPNQVSAPTPAQEQPAQIERREQNFAAFGIEPEKTPIVGYLPSLEKLFRSKSESSIDQVEDASGFGFTLKPQTASEVTAQEAAPPAAGVRVRSLNLNYIATPTSAIPAGEAAQATPPERGFSPVGPKNLGEFHYFLMNTSGPVGDDGFAKAGRDSLTASGADSFDTAVALHAGVPMTGIPPIDLNTNGWSGLAGKPQLSDGRRLAPEDKVRSLDRNAPAFAGTIHEKQGSVGLADINASPLSSTRDELVFRHVSDGQPAKPATAPALIQEGRKLLEAGLAAEAESKLKAALDADPSNNAANYYLSFAKESQHRNVDRLRELASKDRSANVEQDWSSPATDSARDVKKRGSVEPAIQPNGRLESRTFRVDPKLFREGLEGVALLPAKDRNSDLVPIGISGVSRVSVADGTGGGDRVSGVRFLTRTNSMEELHGTIRRFFSAMGVELNTNGKAVFFNDRTGDLLVNATPEDLDRIGAITQSLAPTQVVANTATSLAGAERRLSVERKLGQIQMGNISYDGLPLSEVVRNLSEETRKHDAERKGINFILNPNISGNSAVAVTAAIDPTTGLPVNLPLSEPVDIGSIPINLNATNRQMRMTDLLNAIVKAAERPIKYSVEDWGIMFSVAESEDRPAPVRKPSTNAPIPQPEIQTSENNFSTFSLNVSDVSFKLAAASLEKGQMPDAASVRSEEFINAFDYRDPEPAAGTPIAFAWERVRYPFAHNRDLLRFSLKTAAAGRQAGRPLNIVLLLDNSGSMERADRVSIIREALRVLASQLQSQDKLSVITFARTARLMADGVSGDKAGEVTEQVGGLTPQGGTNLEDAMNLAYQTATRHYLTNGINRVVLLTDGAANLGSVEPESLKQKVEAQRKQGIALDCFGIGWEGFNDDLLEVLSRNGDGRYSFLNSPEEAATDFAGQLAGALKVAASDVKVQVEFNPKRVTVYRQIGYAKHQLTKEQFRDNTVDAAEIAAQEAGNALYTVEVNPAGEGPLAAVRVRYKIPGTTDYREQAWDVPYTGNAAALEQSSPAMRLAATASAFSEWLVASPFAGEVTLDRLISYLGGVPEIYGADARPKKLEWMIRQAKSLQGR